MHVFRDLTETVLANEIRFRTSKWD